jgi:hypothetical protein
MSMRCTDCGFDNVNMTPSTLRKGSSVREPGEPVCASCGASRNKLVRELEQIPNDLALIKAKRQARGAA